MIKQQTALDRFFMALQIRGLLPNDDILKCYEEAKEMEKEQSEKYANYVLELFKKDTNPMSFNLWNETYGGSND
jgi:hypothetical protein